MRELHDITDIVIHGAWTPPDLDIGAAEIDMWHRNRGWAAIGYHYVIRRDGTREEGRPWRKQGAHVRGHNRNSLGIVLVGGQDENMVKLLSTLPDAPEIIKQELAWEFNYTHEQLLELNLLIADLAMDFPAIERIRGHRDYPDVTKRCPGFDVRQYLASTSRLYGWEV